MSKNPELRKLIKAYAVAAIKLAAGDMGSRLPSDDWSDAPEFPFIFSEDKLKRLPEYEKCYKALESDSVIASQLDVMVGTSSRRERSQKAEGLMIRLPHLGIYQNALKFNEEFFRREYQAFENNFYDKNLTCEVVVPLSGPVFLAPIKLSDELEICRVNERDLSLPLKSDVVSNDKSFSSQSIWVIRTQYLLPKMVGDKAEHTLNDTERDEETRNRANETVEQILTCLRLSGVSNAYPQMIIHRTKPWLFPNTRRYPIKYFPTTQFSLKLDKNFNKTFLKFWKSFQKQAVNKHRFIALAAKRFSYAHERHDWEDRIIDLLIAAEAIFLSQAGSQGELKYRLKLHAAMFLATDSKTRKQIFEDMSLAYDLRSKIVHGTGELNSAISKIKKKEAVGLGEKYKLDQFVYRIQNYIRAAINKTIMIASKNKQQEIFNWDELLLNNKQ